MDSEKHSVKKKIFKPFTEIKLRINAKDNLNQLFLGPEISSGCIVSLENNWYFKSSLSLYQSNHLKYKTFTGYEIAILKLQKTRMRTITNAKMKSKNIKRIK